MSTRRALGRSSLAAVGVLALALTGCSAGGAAEAGRFVSTALLFATISSTSLSRSRSRERGSERGIARGVSSETSGTCAIRCVSRSRLCDEGVRR